MGVVRKHDETNNDRCPPKGLILHSDSVSQNCSHNYQKLIKIHGLICRMSKREDCYNNAAVENWNHSFKVEVIHGEQFLTREDAKNHIFEYIEIYDNRKRLHSCMGYNSQMTIEIKK